MLDERMTRWLLGRDHSAREGALRGLLSALWAFLQHPAVHLQDHLTSVEERVKALEAQLVGDLKSAVDTGVVAVEETIAGVEQRLEQDFDRTIRARILGIQARLESVKKRVVEDLKRELRRVALMAALVMVAAVLGLIALVFGLMAAWTGLQGFVGDLGASLVLAVIFLLVSLVVLGALRSVLHRSKIPPEVPIH
jgi:VIT1/CCC1 family predicted Fe2+/Mn2+ transporter